MSAEFMRSAAETVTVWVFWLSVFEVFYSYVLYPVLVRFLAACFGRATAASADHTPTVAVVIPVHNEEAIIADKIKNVFNLDYPSDKLSLWIGSDCSTDRTEEIIRRSADPRIHLWVAPRRSGKAVILNTLVPMADAEVVVLTDADIILEPQSVRALTCHYADPRVGGVGGMIFQRVKNFCDNEETEYLKFEAKQKKMEAALHSIISAFGAFFSIRRSLFVKFDPRTYSNDDVLMPMNIIRQGYRMYFEPDAVSYEKPHPKLITEFQRRIRIGAANAQAFFWLLDFLNPLYGWPWFCYVSHKVSRWLSPLSLCAAAAACAVLAFSTGSLLFKTLLIVGVLCCASGALHEIVPFRLFRRIFYFMAMNTALILGYFKFFGGIRSAVWPRTERQD